MLVGLLKDLNNAYSIILVTLNGVSEFQDAEIICDARYSLGYNSIKDIPSAVFKLRKIIKLYKPSLVRSQLFWSTIITRLACPKKIPMLFSIHSQLSLDAFAHNKFSLFLEKLTYNKHQALISVSKVVLEDYQNFVTARGKKFILNAFVHDNYFNKNYVFPPSPRSPIKLVAVGNLKEVKNYTFLLDAITLIKDEINISLDIIGDGHLRAQLQDIINLHDLPVRLLGTKANVDELLPGYHAFVMCSFHEGFGNAPVEAMAVGLPLILNDLDIMKEMSKENAVFFESGNTRALADIILNFTNEIEQYRILSEQGKRIAKEYYSKSAYFSQLQEIYNEVMDK